MVQIEEMKKKKTGYQVGHLYFFQKKDTFRKVNEIKSPHKTTGIRLAGLCEARKSMNRQEKPTVFRLTKEHPPPPGENYPFIKQTTQSYQKHRPISGHSKSNIIQIPSIKIKLCCTIH